MQTKALKVALITLMLVAAPAIAGDRIVGTVRENLYGGHDVVDLDGDVVLEGRPSLSGGELYRDPGSGLFEFEVRQGLDGDTIFDLDTGADE